MPYRHPPSWRLYTPRGQRKYLNADERRRFLAAADQAAPELRAFAHVLRSTGCRLSEGLRVGRAELNPVGGSLAFRSLKKRGAVIGREVPVPDDLVRLLSALPCPQGRFWPWWGRTTAWRYVKDLMAASGVVGLHASEPRRLLSALPHSA